MDSSLVRVSYTSTHTHVIPFRGSQSMVALLGVQDENEAITGLRARASRVQGLRLRVWDLGFRLQVT